MVHTIEVVRACHHRVAEVQLQAHHVKDLEEYSPESLELEASLEWQMEPGPNPTNIF